MALARFPAMLNTFDPRLQAAIVRIDKQYLANVVKYDAVETALIQDYRDYTDGDQPDALTATQAALLGGDLNYTLNIVETIVSVIADRLKARGVEVVETEQVQPVAPPVPVPTMPEQPDPEQMDAGVDETQPAPALEPEVEAAPTLADQLNPVVRKLWDKNKMDERQADVAWMAGRDGKAFIMPEYNPDEGIVEWAINPAFDGATGVRMVYSEDNYKPLYAVKRWSVVPHPAQQDQTTTLKRMNIYYPDRIEKWVSKGAVGSAGNAENWQPLDLMNTEQVDTEHGSYRATVSWWTDELIPGETVDAEGNIVPTTIIGRNGKPLGIPAFHFKANAQGNAEGKSDIAQIVPGQQDVINRANAMISAGEQFMATPTVFVISNGNIGSEDEPIEKFPGSLTQLPEGTEVYVAPAADLTQLNASLDAKIARAATLSRIPVAYFNVTGQIAAEGTQKQMEVLLTARAERRQKAFGNRYEELVRMSLKLMAMFDPDFTLFSADNLNEIDDLSLSCSWEPAEIRNETEDTQRAVTEKRDLEFPIEIYGDTAGLTTDEIAMIKRHQLEKQHLQDVKNQQMLAALAEELGKDGETTQQTNGAAGNPVSGAGAALAGLPNPMGGIRGG
jgi:hypothetical protein